MRDLNDIDKRVMWIHGPLDNFGIRSAIMDIHGIRCHIIVGQNEDGLEHVSVELMAKRLPTWDEMCEIKDIFWDAEEEVVQIHPRASEYVNITDALHLWRPVDGDWSIMNRKN